MDKGVYYSKTEDRHGQTDVKIIAKKRWSDKQEVMDVAFARETIPVCENRRTKDEAVVLTREIFISRNEEQARNQAPQNVYSPINGRPLSGSQGQTLRNSSDRPLQTTFLTAGEQARNMCRRRMEITALRTAAHHKMWPH